MNSLWDTPVNYCWLLSIKFFTIMMLQVCWDVMPCRLAQLMASSTT